VVAEEPVAREAPEYSAGAAHLAAPAAGPAQLP
jgi:hypothetical protein